MTSAHRSSESAHRSGEPELKTEVFFVKVEDKDAVIVSFVDEETQENEGIFLYEPGADPVELTAVGQEDHATEFEYAHITGEMVDGEEVQWPGDGMTTFAERDAAVERVTEDHANLQQAYDTLRNQAQALVAAVEASHRTLHTGSFTWCMEILCEAARSVEL